MADTAALVIALSAQLTKFEKDMRDAGIMADKAVSDIESKFSKMNPQINASFFGNLFANLATKGLDTAVKAIGEMVDRFLDLQKASEYAGVSMQWLYGVQEAGRKAGASVDEINTSVKNLAFALDEMKRGGDNALKTLLDANPKFLKGVNRDALDVEQTLRIVGNIIGELPNQIQRVDVGRHLGIPPEAVQALRDGGDAFSKVADNAARAAPDLQKIYEYSRELKAIWKDFLSTLQDFASVKFFETLKTDVQDIVSVLQVLAKLFKSGPLEGAANTALETMQGVEARLNKAKEAGAAPPKRIEVTGGTAVDPFARKGGGGAESDFLGRQNDQIEKHIALMQADTEAVGLGIAKQEELRTMALLMTAAQKDGVAVTEEMKLAMQGLAEQAGAAAQKLAEAQFSMSKMNAVSATVGSALSSAFADAIVEGKKLDEVLQSLVKTLLKAAINTTIMSLFTPGAGGGLAPFAALFAGKAGGGPVNSGQSYLVGEQGPELFTPGQTGMITPNSVTRSLGGNAGQSMVYNIDATGADSGTVARIQAVLSAHAKAIASQSQAIASAQRLQFTGVS